MFFCLSNGNLVCKMIERCVVSSADTPLDVWIWMWCNIDHQCSSTNHEKYWTDCFHGVIETVFVRRWFRFYRSWLSRNLIINTSWCFLSFLFVHFFDDKENESYFKFWSVLSWSSIVGASNADIIENTHLFIWNEGASKLGICKIWTQKLQLFWGYSPIHKYFIFSQFQKNRCWRKLYGGAPF